LMLLGAPQCHDTGDIATAGDTCRGIRQMIAPSAQHG